MENRKTQEDVSLLQTRLACGRWEPRSGSRPGLRAESSSEIESRGMSSLGSKEVGRWSGLLGLGEEGQNSVVVVLLADGGH